MGFKNLRVGNYKSFENEVEIEIKPITVIIGKNSSGKSILARLPILLQRALSGKNNGPLDLQFDEFDFGGVFRDLIHNRFEHGQIRLGFDIVVDGKIISLDVSIQNIADTPIQFISNCLLKIGSDFVLELEIDLDSKSLTAPHYNIKGNVTGKYEVKFDGIFPVEIVGVKINASSDLREELDKIRNIVGEIDYTGPFRENPARSYRYSSGPPKETGSKGELAPIILAMDTFEGRELINHVSNWYEKFLGGWKLDVKKNGDDFNVVLVSPSNPNIEINLVDVGHGMSQVLPIIVRSFMNHNRLNTLNIIEQPELHLHPSAHGDLGELISVVATKEHSNFIIETHSENLILRLRSLISEGVLNKNDVIIYSVESEIPGDSKVNKIYINNEGEVSDWPVGVFSESYEEILKINRNKNS